MNLMSKSAVLSSRSILLSNSTFIAFLAVTHLASDAVTHTFSALLPTLQYRFGLTETVLASLVATLAFSASVTQPVFGALADRFGHHKVGAVGVILNAVLLSLIGVVPTVYLLFGLLLIGGLGSAALHPAGASLAKVAGGSKSELAVSLFSAGGTLGVALGPVIILILVATFGLSFTPWLMVPAVVLGLLMFVTAPNYATSSPTPNNPKFFDIGILAGPVGLLSIGGVLSSIAFVTFTNGVPLWLVQTYDLAHDDPLIGWTLAAFALSAALGGVGAGLLSRQISQRLIIVGSMLLALIPLLAIFRQVPGTPLYFLTVMLAGGLSHASLPLMIVKAQDLAPRTAATASGMLMGFAGGMAGVLYIGIGRLQELIGLESAISLSYFTLIPAACLILYVLTKYRPTAGRTTVTQVNALSCLCTPALSPNISAVPCRDSE